MWEYRSISRSIYDADSLVGTLNDHGAEGWELVSVVTTGANLFAVLKKGTAAAAEPAPEAAPEAEAAPTSSEAVEEPVEVPAVAAADAEPISAAAAPESSEEPAGWAAAPEREPEPEPIPVAAGVPSSNDNTTSYGTQSYGAQSYGQSAQTSQPTIAQQAPQPAPQPVVQTPAAWYPDPSGRYEMRYWDGSQWTEHVSRGGVQYTDPPTA